MGQWTMRSIAGWCRMVLLAASVVAAGAVPAGAGALRVDLDLAFFPASIPGNPVFPAGSLLTGAANFYTGPLGDFSVVGPPIDIGRVGIGGHFLFSFIPGEPVEPCLGDGSCQLGFSFGGDAVIPGNPVIPAGGFAQLGDLGTLNLIQGPPILPLDPFELNGPPIRLDGRIVAFDDPELVGTFTVTLSQVPEPSSVMLLLGALAPVPFVLRRRRARHALG